MTASVPVLEGLFDGAGLVSRAAAEVGSVLDEHRSEGPDGQLLADLVVPDQRLAEVSRAAAISGPVSVCVLNTSGAGGLLALAGRSLPHLQVVAVQSALRDLDDLTGNAARIVSAASELDDAVDVYVEIPYAPGWERAVEAVEGAGLLGALRIGQDPAASTATAQLAWVEQLSACVEADLPFRVNGPVGGGFGVLPVVHALVDGASIDQATELFHSSEARRVGAVISGWTAADAARVRRRVHRLEYSSRTALADELAGAGLSR